MNALAITLSVVLTLALASVAEAKQDKRKHAKPAAMSQTRTLGSQPARMIEVRPGYWISSYGCAQDAGYGRFTPCDLTDGNATMTFLPDLYIFLAFTVAGVILVLTPGPDMTLFLGQTLAGGRARGIAAFLGASAGLVVHTMLAAFGLSALLAHSATAFGILKIGGAIYLAWLAIDALRRGSALTLAPGANGAQPLGRVFLMGVGINLLNPKIIMFFLTFLPQFVSASDPHAGAKLMFLGLYFIALGIPICFALIILADRFTPRSAARRA